MQDPRIQGVMDCIGLVERREQYYELYRFDCVERDPGNGHRPGCKGEVMSSSPATFAVLDETKVFMRAHLERLTENLWCETLARNLYHAALLCRSFEIGVYAAASWTSGQLDGQNAWEPGCGRPLV